MTLLADIAAEAGGAFLADFGEEARWTPAGGALTRIAGVFDYAAEVTDIGEMIQRDGVAAVLTVETAAVPGIAHGDAITVRELAYRVVGLEPDGTGHTRIVLGI